MGSKSVLSCNGDAFVTSKGGDKICLAEGMKGKPSFGLRNYKGLRVTTIYWSFNMRKAVYYPISSSIDPVE